MQKPHQLEDCFDSLMVMRELRMGYGAASLSKPSVSPGEGLSPPQRLRKTQPRRKYKQTKPSPRGPAISAEGAFGRAQGFQKPLAAAGRAGGKGVVWGH